MPDLDAPQWERVQELFLAAADLPARERSAFLDAACAGDSALRANVENLLQYDDNPETGLSHVIHDEARAVLESTPRTPEKIGAYRLLQEIGSGGMGTVYLAERDDGEFEHRVAIKIVRRDDSRRDLLARFRLERQILARLNHPNISRFLDGGITPDGQSYFVMEYIEGEPIHKYCKAHDLSINRRIELFRAVCAAVQYSHQNLIVHRDIKLGNILVTAEGTPKLLDFGIAKLLPESGIEPQVTQSMLAALTPEFASPEQLTGDPITTASDIYSLGVVLYRLLAEKSPYRVSSNNIVEFGQCICTEIPPPPSQAAQRRELRGDLDNIVLTALQKDPHRRYTSVEAFSEDLQRYLTGLPVAARTDTFAYRATKFVKRNVAWVAMAAILLTAAAAFLVQLRYQNQRLAKERDKAEKVSDFLADLFGQANPVRTSGKELTAREFLDRGAAEIRKKGLNEDPETYAKVSSVIGQTYHQLGQYKEAINWFQSSLQSYRAAGMARSEDALLLLERLANTKVWMADYAGAELIARQQLDIVTQLGKGRDREIEQALRSLCVALRSQNKPEGDAVCKRQLELAKKVYSPDAHDLAIAYINVGSVALMKNDPAAIEHLQSALTILRKKFHGPHPTIVSTLGSLGSALRSQDRIEEALAAYQESVQMTRTLYPGGHLSTESALWGVGNCLSELHRFEEAANAYQQSLDMIRKLFPDHPDLGYTLHAFAVLRHRMGDTNSASAMFHEVLDLRRRRSGENSTSYAAVATNYAILLADLGRPDEAEKVLRQSLATQERLLDPKASQLAQTRSHLAVLLIDRGQHAEAEPLIRKAIECYRPYVVPSSWRITFVESVLTVIQAHRAQNPDAAESLQAAYTKLSTAIGDKDYRTRWINRHRKNLTPVN